MIRDYIREVRRVWDSFTWWERLAAIVGLPVLIIIGAIMLLGFLVAYPITKAYSLLVDAT